MHVLFLFFIGRCTNWEFGNVLECEKAAVMVCSRYKVGCVGNECC